MKRFLICCLLLLMLGMTFAVAEEQPAIEYEFTLPYAEITFALPEDMLCLTRETSASVFRKWNMEQREVWAFMEENDVYALIFDLVTGNEYQIVAYPWESEDYDVLMEKYERELCGNVYRDLSDIGYTVQTHGAYRSARHAYVFAETAITFEDGSTEQRCLYLTCQGRHNVEIYAYPLAGDITDTLRNQTRAIADSLSIVRLETPPEGYYTVTTQELPDGRFVLSTGDMAFTFTPIDIRYCITRESSQFMFNNMDVFDQTAMLKSMEEYNLYAMLFDHNRRARVQVHLYPYGGAQEYTDMSDWMVEAVEKLRFNEYGWTVHGCDAFETDGLMFGRTLVSVTREDGSEEWRLIYMTRHNGIEMEIQVLTSGRKIIEAVEGQTDEFVRSIRCTYDTE